MPVLPRASSSGAFFSFSLWGTNPRPMVHTRHKTRHIASHRKMPEYWSFKRKPETSAMREYPKVPPARIWPKSHLPPPNVSSVTLSIRGITGANIMPKRVTRRQTNR